MPLGLWRDLSGKWQWHYDTAGQSQVSFLSFRHLSSTSHFPSSSFLTFILCQTLFLFSLFLCICSSPLNLFCFLTLLKKWLLFFLIFYWWSPEFDSISDSLSCKISFISKVSNAIYTLMAPNNLCLTKVLFHAPNSYNAFNYLLDFSIEFF